MNRGFTPPLKTSSKELFCGHELIAYMKNVLKKISVAKGNLSSRAGFTPPLKRNKAPNLMSKICLFFKSSSSRAGFTLVEVAVVAAITGVITTFMLVNFQRNRTDLALSSNEFIANLRSAQSKAAASARYDSGAGLKIRCGYGIRYISPTSYSMYAGPDASSVNCSALNRNFDGADATMFTRVFTDTRVELKSPFNDIFFEPPDPKTYINNDPSLALPPQAITIGKIGGLCPNDCKTINVYTSGKIQ